MTPLLLHVVGARPNFMKAAPVVDALARRSVSQYLVHTGQHYDRALSEVFFEELGLPRPDVDLGVGSGTHADQTAALLRGLEPVIAERRPSMVVVYGDVNSTLAAALVCSKLHVRFAHVEAGLRSFDRAMPEEVNRVVTDALADLHFVTSHEAIGHLEHEGIEPDRIHMVGNTMIDTLLRFRDAVDPAAVRAELGLEGPYGVVTLHRPSNVDDPDVAHELVAALDDVARLTPLVFPVHPRGRQSLAEAGLIGSARLHLVDPLPYTSFLALMADSSIVLTDSGGIQEETTVLGVPGLTLRWNTERPVTVTHGTNQLVGTDRSAIVGAARTALEATELEARRPPLWDGRAGERIAQVLQTIVAD
jgi:UDP-N-acetylglucosamine 2-epimerase (non-hydrolysing)